MSGTVNAMRATCTVAGGVHPNLRGVRVRSCRTAAALLEVVIAVSILMLTMSVVGLTMRNSEINIEQAERFTRARAMTERILVELDTGILDVLREEERERSGYFGEDETLEGMSWLVEIEPHEDIEGLLELDIHIFLGDPDGSEEEHQRLLTTRVFRVEPRGFDFEEDFGMDEDQIQDLADAIPGGAAMFDPNDFDPRVLAQLELDELVELLPTLLQMFGAGAMEGQLGDLLEAAQSGDMGAIQDAAQGAQDAMGGESGEGGFEGDVGGALDERKGG